MEIKQNAEIEAQSGTYTTGTTTRGVSIHITTTIHVTVTDYKATVTATAPSLKLHCTA